MSRRLKRAGMWGLVAGLVIVVGLLVVGLARPAWANLGRASAGVQGWTLDVSWLSSVDAGARITRGEQGWDVVGTQVRARLLMAAGSEWRPTVQDARMGIVGGTGPVWFDIRAVFVPLWPVAVVLGIGAAGLRWWAGKPVRAGHCACGYDVRGLATCPECGVVVRMLRVFAAVLRVVSERGGRASVRASRGWSGRTSAA